MVRLPLSFIIVICALFCGPGTATAKISPAEGMTLNYRIIGFAFPNEPGATHYTIEIATGDINDAARFKPEITASSQQNHIIATVPNFGKNYTWRIVYLSGKKTKVSALYHFSTGNLPETKTAKARIRVTTNKVEGKHFYIMAESADAIYDVEGKPIWYMPAWEGNINDLKCTPQHTLTFISDGRAYEVSCTGKLLWKSPELKPVQTGANSADSALFHHEIWRLSNGHYMALVSDPNVVAPKSATGQSMQDINDRQGSQHFFPAAATSTLYEFDSNGKVVWQWRSADYFSHATNMENSLFRRLLSQGMSGHENAFYFDEKEQEIYLSLADFNRILRISYPSGNVINSLGANYDPLRQTDSMMGPTRPFRNYIRASIFKNSQFSGQHACRKTADGELLLYNNNMHDTAQLPEVQLYKIPERNKPGVLQKVWSFQCPTDGCERTKKNSGGGCVSEMGDGSIFVSMNFPYGKFFIVNRAKQITWCAMPEKKDETGKWVPLQSYRATVISREALEELIWHGEDVHEELTADPRKANVLSSQ